MAPCAYNYEINGRCRRHLGGCGCGYCCCCCGCCWMDSNRLPCRSHWHWRRHPTPAKSADFSRLSKSRIHSWSAPQSACSAAAGPGLGDDADADAVDTDDAVESTLKRRGLGGTGGGGGGRRGEASGDVTGDADADTERRGVVAGSERRGVVGVEAVVGVVENERR